MFAGILQRNKCLEKHSVRIHSRKILELFLANGRHTKPEAVAQLVPCMVLFKALHHPGILWCLLINVCHAEWRHYFARASELWEYLISKFRSVKWIFGIGNKQLTEESFKQSWHLFPQRLQSFFAFSQGLCRQAPLTSPLYAGWQLSTRSPSCLWWVCLPSVACGWRSTDQLCHFLSWRIAAQTWSSCCGCITTRPREINAHPAFFVQTLVQCGKLTFFSECFSFLDGYVEKKTSDTKQMICCVGGVWSASGELIRLAFEKF